MEIFFIKALQLILSLSLLVVLHEGGHFLFAKLFKIRVEKFCLFFDPKFTLLKFKPKRSDTTYALGWLPLGGYVKIAGMIDESMDTEQMKQPVKPWEFRAKVKAASRHAVNRHATAGIDYDEFTVGFQRGGSHGGCQAVCPELCGRFVADAQRRGR